jgi:hypothetical protein
MRWQKNWSATSSCRQSKYFTPWVDRTRTKRVLKLTRNKLTQLTSIATGHAYTGWHLYTVLKEGTVPLCECGKESQDVVHLYTCVDEIYGNSKSMDAKGNHDINSILNYFQLPPIAGMMAERKEEYKKLYDARKGEQGHAREVSSEATLAKASRMRPGHEKQGRERPRGPRQKPRVLLSIDPPQHTPHKRACSSASSRFKWKLIIRIE